ncbi:MAG TPA: small ribosomal subunit Rsm22 family protein [Kofleriaceae bacterium]|nr:small ribosomal subunit Rsm22 family protein [Kofleriaceae bacterium]
MSSRLVQLEDALWRAAEASVPPAALAPAELARAVTLRSRRYTSERELLDEPLAGHAGAADLAARALFFGVADAAKVSVPLAELDRSAPVPARAPLRLLDLGAGAGAMTLGTAAHLAAGGRAVDLSVVAIDRDRAALSLFAGAAGHLSLAVGGRIELEHRAELLRDARLEPGGFDLVVAGGVMNELDEATRFALVERALAALADGGALVIVEPALRETSRDLHRVRDRVLAAGLGHVFAPCTRTAAPCPALARERDWCHEDRPLALPPRASRLAQVTGLRDSGMKFSYLVLRRAADPLVASPADRAALRIVSAPKRLKGRRECIGCGDSGWVDLRLLSRRRSDANRAFERLRRGDVLVIDRAGLEDERRDLREDEAAERVAIDPAG